MNRPRLGLRPGRGSEPGVLSDRSSLVAQRLPIVLLRAIDAPPFQSFPEGHRQKRHASFVRVADHSGVGWRDQKAAWQVEKFCALASAVTRRRTGLVAGDILALT